MLAVATAFGAAACREQQAPPRVQMLPSPAGPGAGESNLTVGGDGKLYLSWLQPTPDSQTALRFAVLDGDQWSAPRDIHVARDFFINWADFPSMSVRADGRMAAHWLQKFGGKSYSYDVRIAQSADGGLTWGEPVAPHVDRSLTEKGFVTLWPEGDGFSAVWLDARKSDQAGGHPHQEMMLYTSTNAAAPTASELQLDDRTCDCCQTTVTITGQGPMVAYRNRTADEIRDIYYVRRVDGKWTAPRAVHDDGWRIDACPVNGPMLAAAGDHVVIAWYTGANDTPRVNVAFSTDAGATFGAPIAVDEGHPVGRVAAVLLPDGSALVSWIERTEGNAAAVRLRRVREGAGAGQAFTAAESSTARASGFPRMVAAGQHVYFSWTVSGTPSEVRVARLSVADLQ